MPKTLIACLLCAVAGAACAQTPAGSGTASAALPPLPGLNAEQIAAEAAADQRSLTETMQSLDVALNHLHPLSFSERRSDLHVTGYNTYTISDAHADPAACTLTLTEIGSVRLEADPGYEYSERGVFVSKEDLVRGNRTTSVSSLGRMAGLIVRNYQDQINRGYAWAGHPELTSAVDPAVYTVRMQPREPNAVTHEGSSYVGRQTPVPSKGTWPANTFSFGDRETAVRIAESLLHAITLCGGGKEADVQPVLPPAAAH